MKRNIGLVLFNIILIVSMLGLPGMAKVSAQPTAPDEISASCGSDPTQVGCWLFSEGTGTTTADGSANGNTGTLVNNDGTMWVADRFGNPGKALHFNGTDNIATSQYVKVPNSASLDITDDITIAAWVKPEREATQDLVKKATNGGIGGYELALSTLTGNCITPAEKPCAFGRINQVPSGDDYRVDTLHQYDELDPWTFYVFTTTAADHTIRMYKNGTISTSTDVTTIPSIVSNSLFLGIGAQLAGIVDPPTASRWFKGSLDDIRIYNRALSASEIASLYNNVTPAGYSCTSLTSQAGTANTGEKPMSKVWTYDGKWWSIFPANTGVSSAGAWLWQLVGSTWIPVLKLSSNTSARADVKPAGSPVGSVVHILLYNNAPSADLASVEYFAGTYRAWSSTPVRTTLPLNGSETATIDIDSTGRMWLNTQHDVSGSRDIIMYDSAYPYSSWNGPTIIGTGTVIGDDISVVTALPNNTIGVLWANENTHRFVFRYHIDGDPNTNWSTEELPASQFEYDQGAGFSDDHINVKVATDGTLYAAIKTSYDTAGYPKIALMVRRLRGTSGEGDWDQNIYVVNGSGTRGIVELDEVAGIVSVIYTSVEGGGNIVYKQSAIQPIAFGTELSMRSGSNNDVSSTRQNINGELVAIYSSGTTINGSYCTSSPTVGVDLSITKTDGKEVGQPGEDSTYTIVVSNDSTQAVSNVVVADAFPSTLSGVTWACTPGVGSTCTSSGSGNINDTITLAASSSVTYIADATIAPDATGVIANTASVTPPEGVTDPDPADNTATDYTSLQTANDLCGSDPNLVACYQLDEGSGNSFLDGAQNPVYNDGTTVGNPTWGAGINGTALYLDGSTQYGDIPDDNSLDVTTDVTLAAWIRPDGTNPTTQRVIAKTNMGSVNGYELSLGSGGVVFVRFNQATSGDTYRINSTTNYPLNDSAWMHVAATYNGSVIRLYINGVQEGVDLAMAAPIVTNSLDLAIGSEPPGSSNNYKLHGSVDDVRVYNRALSAGEIAILANRSPALPITPVPADGAPVEVQGGDNHVDLQATVSDPDTPTGLTVNFYGQEFTPSQNFTLAVLPDTQNYVASGGNRAMFDTQTQWIVNNAVAENIVYVTHLGDIVNTYDSTFEWDIAGKSTTTKGALTALDDAGIPYGLALGNHDNNSGAGPTTVFNNYFGASRFTGHAYYGGHFGTDNDNNYGLFTVGSLKFIVIQLEYTTSPDTNVLLWADGLLGADTSRRGILVFHDLIGSNGQLTTYADTIYDYLKHNTNLFLMLGGHMTTEVSLTLTDSGHTIYALRSDYQDRTGGNGWMRLMEFQPQANQIQVSTYSPFLGQSETDADSQFTLAYNMGGKSINAFELIGTVTGVSSGTNVSMPWPNLVAGTSYQWYTTVSDGVHTTTSPTWWFSIAEPTPVRLAGFNAMSLPQGIQLSWQTAQEVDLLGFNLYRAEALDGPQVMINPQLIAAINPGQLQGNAYRYVDPTAAAGKVYFYWVEWVSSRDSERFGPLSASLAPYAVWLPIGLNR